MKKLLLFFTIFLFLFITSYLQAAEMLDFEKLSKLPVSELFSKANHYIKINHVDTAMGYYGVLVSKYTPNMNKPDKYLYALTYSSMGQIYYQIENKCRISCRKW